MSNLYCKLLSIKAFERTLSKHDANAVKIYSLEAPNMNSMTNFMNEQFGKTSNTVSTPATDKVFIY